MGVILVLLCFPSANTTFVFPQWGYSGTVSLLLIAMARNRAVRQTISCNSSLIAVCLCSTHCCVEFHEVATLLPSGGNPCRECRITPGLKTRLQRTHKMLNHTLHHCSHLKEDQICSGIDVSCLYAGFSTRLQHDFFMSLFSLGVRKHHIMISRCGVSTKVMQLGKLNKVVLCWPTYLIKMCWSK